MGPRARAAVGADVPAAPAKKAAKTASKPGQPARKSAAPAKAPAKRAPAEPPVDPEPAQPAAPAPQPWAPVPREPTGWTAAGAAWVQQPWSGGPTPPALPTRPVQGLAGALVVLLAGVVGWAALNLALMVLVPGWGSPAGAQGAMGVFEQLGGLVSIALSIAFIVVFCMWLYRVMANARQRHPMAGISPGWAVGSFFIPIVHLFAPYVAVRRAWQADVEKDPGTLTGWFVPWAVSVLAGYVTIFIVVSLGVQAAMEAVDAGSAEDADAAIEALGEEMRPWQVGLAAVSLALQSVSAVFLVRVVRKWTALQEGRPVS